MKYLSKKRAELSELANKYQILVLYMIWRHVQFFMPPNFRMRRPTPAAAAATAARPAVPAPRDIGGGDDAAPLAPLALPGRLGAAAAQVEHAGAEGRGACAVGAAAEPIPGGDIHDDASRVREDHLKSDLDQRSRSDK